MDLPAFLLPALLATDAALVGVAAWLVVAASGHARRGALETGLAWGVAFAALVAGAGVILGATGGFGPGGFLALHALALVGLILARRPVLAADFDAGRLQLREVRRHLDTAGPERAVGLGLLIVLAALTTLAALVHATVFDTLTYHLPRVGQWLQDGRIGMLVTADARMNFVSAIPEVFTAWLVMGTAEGFRLAVVPQALGGIMAVAATVGLARQAGLGRTAALLAGALLLGMANVVVQFTAAQTDLITTGIFAAAFHLWLGALRRGVGSSLGAVGVGLALGAKGTLFYLAPAAIAWVLWLGRRHPLAPRQWGRTLLAAALGGALFAGPGFVRNWRAYGSALGPGEWVGRVHRPAESTGELATKLGRNLVASLAQNCEPNSQPHSLRAVGRSLGTALAALVATVDGFTLDGLSRRQTLLTSVLPRTKPDADVTTFGLVTLALFANGTLLALVRFRRSASRLILVWSGGVAVFLVYYHAMQQWHPFGFRYFVLVAPWIAVVSAWGLEQLPRHLRWIGWAGALVAAGDVGWAVTTHTPQAGWLSFRDPERVTGNFVSQAWREWSQQLEPADSPLVVALPEERPVTGFHRQSPARWITLQRPPGARFATAEEFSRATPGWSIVPATRFLGREGRVAAKVWLFQGDERHPFSLAAYRELRPAEKPTPIVYRHLSTRRDTAIDHHLLVKSWQPEFVRLALDNPGPAAVTYEVVTPLRRETGQLTAGTSAVIAAALPANVVAELHVIFRPGDTHAIGPVAPTVALAP